MRIMKNMICVMQCDSIEFKLNAGIEVIEEVIKTIPNRTVKSQ